MLDRRGEICAKKAAHRGAQQRHRGGAERAPKQRARMRTRTDREGLLRTAASRSADDQLRPDLERVCAADSALQSALQANGTTQ